MMSLKKSVAAFLEKHSITGEAKLLLACSGGIDSMVLVSILQQLNYSPALVHCNFGLRQKYSDRDEEFVRAQAAKRGLAFYSRRFNTESYAGQHGLSIQMAARELRYSYFNELMAAEGFDHLLLAHHADDSLESVLMNLGRGSGLLSMAGIDPDPDKILRPLWLNTRDEISEYARQHDIKWREDASNQSDNYQRNFIRHHVVPPLKEAFPDFTSGLKKSLRQAHADKVLFEKLLEKKLNSALIREGNQTKLPLEILDGLPPESLLYHWLKAYGKFDYSAIVRSLQNRKPGRIFENENQTLLLDRNYLILQPKNLSQSTEALIDKNDEHLSAPIALEIKTVNKETFEIPAGREAAALDLDKLEFPLTLRKWRPGDAFVPLGMKGSKKLSDFFIDEKLDRYQKEDIWLLCSGADICWIVGKRIDDRYKITDTTKSVYFVRLK